MMKVINFIFITVFCLSSFAQKLPSNFELGKCYQACFDYNSKVEYKEIDCDSIKSKTNSNDFIIKGEEALDYLKRKVKFEKYQEKLVKLGYNLEVTGYPDLKTVNAHHKYLKDKKKALRKEKRLAKKAKNIKD